MTVSAVHEPILAEEVEDFLAWYSRRRRRQTGSLPADATLKFRRGRLRWAAQTYSGTIPSSLRGLAEGLGDRRFVTDLLDDLDVRMSPGAARQVFYALRDLGEWAEANDLIRSCALEQTDCPSKNPDPPIDIYTADEMALLKEASFGRSFRFGCFVNFLAETGRRVGEGLSLEWAWMRLDEEPPHFRLPTTKAGEAQYVPLTPRLTKRVFTTDNVMRMKAEDVGPYGRPFKRDVLTYPFPWGYGTVHSTFGRLCDSLAIPNRGFHNFRHTVITNRLAAGWPLQAVSALAGHVSPQTTSGRYNHTTALTFAHLLTEDADE